MLKEMFLLFFLIKNVIGDDGLIEVAQSPTYQWNGVALTKSNRMFASFPRSLGDETISVGEIFSNNQIIPYPGLHWNTFNPINSSEYPQRRFVNINAVLTDSNDNLWVVDSGTIGNKTYFNASKLVKINLNTNSVERIYYTSQLNVPVGFALNDVRIGSRYAYLTESGLGSLVLIDLESGEVRRVLSDHPSTQFQNPTVVRMEGRVVSDQDGQPKKMANNNLELTPNEEILYYKPSFSFNWFTILTKDLLNQSLNQSQLGEKVSLSWKTMPTGGTTMDQQGFIYLMDLEREAIWKQNILDGSWKLIRQDSRIIWGDASDISQDGYLYIPISQNNRIPSFNNRTNQVIKPFLIYKIQINSSNTINNNNIFIYFFILLIKLN